jgi:hypothetical protein
MGNVLSLTNVMTTIVPVTGQKILSSTVVYNSVMLIGNSVENTFQKWNWQCLTNIVVTSNERMTDILLVMDFSAVSLPPDVFLKPSIRPVGTLIVNNKVFASSDLVTCTVNNMTVSFLIRPVCPKKNNNISLNCILVQDE